MKDSSVLRKKLAAYSALASSVLTTVSTESDAQIIYVDINPDTNVIAADNFFIDLNNDGVFDFKFTYSEWGTSEDGGGAAKIWALDSNKFWAYSESNDSYPGSPYPLLAGAFIGATDGFPSYYDKHWQNGNGRIWSWGYDFNGTTSGANGWDGGPFWHPFENRYLGFILNLPDGKHYGWMRIYYAHTLKDYAYESIPDSSLLADQKDVATNVQTAIDNKIKVFQRGNQIYIHTQNLLPGSTIELLNVTGQKLYDAPMVDNELIFDGRNLPAGIYFIVLRNHLSIEAKKIMIAKS